LGASKLRDPELGSKSAGGSLPSRVLMGSILSYEIAATFRWVVYAKNKLSKAKGMRRRKLRAPLPDFNPEFFERLYYSC
jgi:hypothetical protein